VAFAALIIQVREDTVFGMGIQAEPCYSGSVIHNEPLVVVAGINNLADAWRIRICAFTERLDCSIHQVVRFSIYQQPTPVGVVSSADAGYVIGPAWLSLGRHTA
jgi:hypothetical protein